MQKVKRYISFILCFVMMFSVLSVGSIASEPTNDDETGSFSYQIYTDSSSISKPMKTKALKAPAKSSTADDKLVLSKNISIEDQLNEIYKLTLSSYAIGEIQNGETVLPVDFLIMFDQSSSMTNEMEASMKKGIRTFIDKVRESYSPTSDHRISFLGFTESSTVYDVDNDRFELPSLVDNCWISVNDSSTCNKAIDKISTRGVFGITLTDIGFEKADKFVFNKLYKTNNTYNDRGRFKVVIMFSDGLPTSVTPFMWWSSLPADKTRAIKKAKVLKDKNITIYGIGVGDQLTTSEGKKFLQYVSSEYPNATSWTSPGQSIGKAYSWAAVDTNRMPDFFTNVATAIPSVPISLNEDALLKDYITDYFDIYINSSFPATIQIENADQNGAFPTVDSSYQLQEINKTLKANGLTFTVSSNCVSATGFDYVKNFVTSELKTGYSGATGGYGKRLVVSYYVKPKSSFMGGNGVPVTVNGPSGIYADSTEQYPMQVFNAPTANISIKANLATMNNESWHGENALENKNFTDFAAITAPTSETFNLTNKGLNNINNAFVKIEENYYDGETLVAKHTVLPYEEDEYEFYSAEFMSGNLNTVPATLKEYIEYKALNANENQFVQPIRVVATVSPIYTIDENDPQGTSTVQNSLGDVVSEQTANANYTITYNFCTLTIGQNEYDYVNGKFRDKSNNFYDIYYNNEYYMSVLGGTTIYEMPVGNYKVVLHTSDTRYNQIEQWEVASASSSEGIASSDNSVSFELSRRYYENHLTVTPDASYYTRQSQYLDNHNTLIRNAASSTHSINGSYSVVS